MSQTLIGILDFVEPELEEDWALCEMERSLCLKDWLLLLKILGEEDDDFHVEKHRIVVGLHTARFLLSPQAVKAYHAFNDSLCKSIVHEAADFSTAVLTT